MLPTEQARNYRGGNVVPYESERSGVVPIEYTRYGDLRVGDWIAFENTVAEVASNASYGSVAALTLTNEDTGLSKPLITSTDAPCVRIVLVESDAI
jgi:hypothetical protein